MALFGKKDTPTTADSRMGKKQALASLIDEQMVIEGNISFTGKTRIDGTVNGDIRGEQLIIGETGTINGNITADAITCYGTITGKIEAGMFTACPTCILNGQVNSKDLSVESGATLNAEIRQGSRQPETAEQENTAATEQTP
ncbi:MAG: polymer-forming cytoskeletal protein [Desulfobulbaceae bacterium]|uniref:Polymer-forming cytoskeletal protein n=1 Tax=Candidatus Desulfatifera sulfidica TaxID=2841691 RepID=A0A8J6TAF9_9BACT|nr:polymer-forming cytoskeletal protein [Candidatus Desulfatifera sulfidica]